MKLIEGSETSAIRTQTLGNYPKENMLHIEHGESLKSRKHIHKPSYMLQQYIAFVKEALIQSNITFNIEEYKMNTSSVHIHC